MTGTAAIPPSRSYDKSILAADIITWKTEFEIFTFFPGGQVAGRSDDLTGSGTGDTSKFAMNWSNGVEVTYYCLPLGGVTYEIIYANSAGGHGVEIATQQ